MITADDRYFAELSDSEDGEPFSYVPRIVAPENGLVAQCHEIKSGLLSLRSRTELGFHFTLPLLLLLSLPLFGIFAT